jgi:hypothetical protein
MKWVELEKILIAAARKDPPGDQVPYAFEQRIMARLRATSPPGPDAWAAWARAWWCGAGACAAVALVMGVWTFVPDDDSEAAADFAQDIEYTILASAADTEDADNSW